MRRSTRTILTMMLASMVVGSCDCDGEDSLVAVTLCDAQPSVSVAPTILTLDPGQQGTATATQQHPCDGFLQPTWTSAGPSTAVVQSVSPGTNPSTATIEGVKGGTTRVVVSLGNGTQEHVDITVNPAEISISPSPIAVDVGQSAAVTANLTHTDGSPVTLPVEWEIANANVATVATSGDVATVTGASPGSTRLTATAGTSTAQATVDVSGQAQPVSLFGTMFGGDGATPLPGVTVLVSGVGSDVTDSNGNYRIDVTPGGSFQVSALGICDTDPVHPCSFELSYNTTDVMPVDAPAGAGEVRYDPQARDGYHLSIDGGASSPPVSAGAAVPLQLDYQVWNRRFLPGAAPRMVVGIEEDAQHVQAFGVPGLFPGASGTADVTLTAPGAAGQYGVYARLVTASASFRADSIYEAGFQDLKTTRYVRLFTLIVQ